MTPNLKRLFDAVKQNTFCDDADVLVAIFERHGEALVEALEMAQDDYYGRVDDDRAWELYKHIRDLLAQLESEAQL